MCLLAANLSSDNQALGGLVLVILIIVFCILCIAVYFLPSIVAFQRNHHYRWVIFGINLFFGATGLAYLAVLIWAFWPKNTGLIDVVRNDLTANSFEANRVIYSKQGANTLVQQQASIGMLVYVLKNGTQNGPYPSGVLTSYLQNRNFSYQDLCWYQGAPGWARIADVANIIGVPPDVAIEAPINVIIKGPPHV